MKSYKRVILTAAALAAVISGPATAESIESLCESARKSKVPVGVGMIHNTANYRLKTDKEKLRLDTQSTGMEAYAWLLDWLKVRTATYPNVDSDFQGETTGLGKSKTPLPFKTKIIGAEQWEGGLEASLIEKPEFCIAVETGYRKFSAIIDGVNVPNQPTIAAKGKVTTQNYHFGLKGEFPVPKIQEYLSVFIIGQANAMPADLNVRSNETSTTIPAGRRSITFKVPGQNLEESVVGYYPSGTLGFLYHPLGYRPTEEGNISLRAWYSEGGLLGLRVRQFGFELNVITK